MTRWIGLPSRRWPPDRSASGILAEDDGTREPTLLPGESNLSPAKAPSAAGNRAGGSRHFRQRPLRLPVRVACGRRGNGAFVSADADLAGARARASWRRREARGSSTMSLSCFFNPLHGCLLHANGHGEVWTDWNSTSKFFQYGWRCTTNEDSYANKTLLGNWNEERYDIRKVLQPQPLPSQYAHYFESTYSSDYSKEKPHSTRRVAREPHWFPGHQPELQPPAIKPTARSCYMIDYEPPYGRGAHLRVDKKTKEAEGVQLKQ